MPLVCSDPDGDPLTLSAVTQPSKGTLGSIVGGMVTYTPAGGEYGADSFTFEADDGTADSPPATVDVSISRPPTCDDASLTARAGTAVTIPLTCTDADGDDLTLAKATGPTQGTLSAFGATLRHLYARPRRRWPGQLHLHRVGRRRDVAARHGRRSRSRTRRAATPSPAARAPERPSRCR